LIGSVDVICCTVLTRRLSKSHQLIFMSCTDHKSDPACNSHGQYNQPKTIDYHHMDMSKEDGMDEHGIDWLCGYVIW
jgi:hypothetical protein